MTKFFSTLIIGGALATASLSAAELNHQHDVAPSAPSVLFGYEPQTQDLLSIASNGAVTEQSPGVYVLSALEMQQVQGGSLKKFWKRYKKPLEIGLVVGLTAAGLNPIVIPF